MRSFRRVTSGYGFGGFQDVLPGRKGAGVQGREAESTGVQADKCGEYCWYVTSVFGMCG